MTLSPYLPLFVAVPLAGALLISLVAGRGQRLIEILTVAIPSLLFLLALGTLAGMPRTGVLVHCVGGWAPPVGIGLVEDNLTAYFLVIVHAVASAIALYSVSYIRHYTSPWKFFCLFLVLLAGINGVLITGDLFNLFVFMEIASLSACTLVAFGIERTELEAGFKYGVMSAVGALFVLLGIALLYGMTSTLDMDGVAAALRSGGGRGGAVVLLVTVLFIVGFGVKAALAPFHAWLPDAHPAAPAPISAMLSGLIIKCLGVYALIRILFGVIGMTPAIASNLRLLGALSMGVGAFLALGQKDVKRLLAYSSMSQVGYIVFGIGLGTPLGILGGLFHLFNHAFGKSLLFLSAGAVDYATGTRDLDRLGGLSRKMPVTSAAATAGAMSIGGVPPFAGFWSKLVIIVAAVEAGHLGYAVWAVLCGVLTLTYLTKAVARVFQGPLPDKWKNVREVPWPMRTAMAALALVCLVGGLALLPPARARFLGPAAQTLIAAALPAGGK